MRAAIMETEFFTYLDFLMHTKAVIFILIIASLIGIACFWNFLSGKDEDNYEDDF